MSAGTEETPPLPRVGSSAEVQAKAAVEIQVCNAFAFSGGFTGLFFYFYFYFYFPWTTRIAPYLRWSFVSFRIETAVSLVVVG